MREDCVVAVRVAGDLQHSRPWRRTACWSTRYSCWAQAEPNSDSRNANALRRASFHSPLPWFRTTTRTSRASPGVIHRGRSCAITLASFSGSLLKRAAPSAVILMYSSGSPVADHTSSGKCNGLCPLLARFICSSIAVLGALPWPNFPPHQQEMGGVLSYMTYVLLLFYFTGIHT